MDNGIEFKMAEASDGDEGFDRDMVADNAKKGLRTSSFNSSSEVSPDANDRHVKVKMERGKGENSAGVLELRNEGKYDSGARMDRDKTDSEWVNKIGMASIQGTSDRRYLGSTSGISFARLVLAAVRNSVNGNGSERSSIRLSERLPQGTTGSSGSTLRDSFFGLQARPSMKPATFPDRELAERLVELYFEHANPQMPILHRGEFMELFDRIYSTEAKSRSFRDLYIVNIVFAIGAGIIYDGRGLPQDEEHRMNRDGSPSAPPKRQKLSSHQYQPEEYHASAVAHLEALLGSSSSGDGFGGGLEELQAVLLLAGLALLRPVPPGLWYIVGVAVRLAIDLGLHYEDGTEIDSFGEENVPRAAASTDDQSKVKLDPRERGRREWVRDLRRRLWWCVYSFDRLVSTCVGRPFGINDLVITTEFPSLLDDRYITKSGFMTPPQDAPSYKNVSHHYFKLRLLQSEIQQVLQYQQARLARKMGNSIGNAFRAAKLTCPFLQPFESFRLWRKDVRHRLSEWKASAPTREETGVQFSLEFLELNYWQALIMLYRQGLTVPARLAGELSPVEEVSSPSFSSMEECEDEDDMYVEVAEAGQKILRLYRKLHDIRVVNYTYLATHHLFMAGISFLCALWHSPVARSRLTGDEVELTVLSAISVLGDLVQMCPPAEAYRGAFERMSRATVQMCTSTGGFGAISDLGKMYPGALVRPGVDVRSLTEYHPSPVNVPSQQQSCHSRQPQSYEMNPGSLFTDPCQSPTSARQRSQGQPMTFFLPEQPPGNFQQGASYMQSYGMPQPYYHPNSPQSVSSGSGPLNYGASLKAEQDGLDLDFLDFSPITGQNTISGPDGNQNHNPLAYSPLVPGLDQSTGVDLGFGMALDFQHDWSEGGGYSLLDDFFFGGANGGNQL